MNTAPGQDRHEIDVADIPDAELVKLLTHLDRHTRAGRLRAAQDPITRAYLQAGIRLVARQFAATDTDDEELDDAVTPSPFFAWVSRAKVIDELRNDPDSASPRAGNINGMRDRWDPHKGYISDLLNVILGADHWSSRIAHDPALVQDLRAGDDFAAAAHEMAYLDLKEAAVSAVTFQVQLIATCFAERDETVRAALKDLYTEVNSAWSRVYTEALTARGLKLRPGVTMEDLTNILTATAEGLALRMMADPNANVLDEQNHRSILGIAALSLFASSVDLFDDGASLEDSIRSVFGPQHVPGE